jgi:hypothetical protein
VVVGQFIFIVDAFIFLNVAIPSICADLHASTGEIEAVIVLYQITFAVLARAGGSR